MGIEDILWVLLNPTAHDPDLAGMGLLQHLAKRVLSLRQVGAHIVVWDLAGILGSDTARRHHQYVGVEPGNVGDKVTGVERGVGFTKVGL